MNEHVAPSHCLNCGAAVANSFCSVCGQETVLHVPSVREFFHEFIGHYVALEGKLWKTLALLIFRPGRLTAEYIAGRRARYVAPLRVYLSLSVLFFALLHYAPNEYVVVKPAAEAPNRMGFTDKPPGPDTVRINSKLIGVNPAWDARLQQITALPGSEIMALLRSKFFAYVPYAMFLIMPLFALYLKLLYLGTGRRYGEHMLFALHTNGFAFLLLGLMWVAPWNWTWLIAALSAWLVGYLPVAMRRVYGGSRKATALRWAVLMAVYVVTVIAAIFGTIFVATIVI